MVFAIVVLLSARANAEWTPPEKPDPSQILEEARADTAAKRYEDALAKHVWYHENALKYQPGQYGVRLSFAMSHWDALGKAYPPALETLKSIRDDDDKIVRNGKGTLAMFHDVTAINRTLKEDGKTKDLFVWLDANEPKLAQQVFGIAQPALIKAKEYKLCGRYIDPDKSLEQILLVYRQTKKVAKDPRFDKSLQEHAGKTFSHDTATLVALLVLNDRKPDADRIAALAMKEWDDPKLKKGLDRAKTGELPAPYP
jgi:hypothetical protein